VAELEYSIDLKKDLVTQFTDQPNISVLAEVIQKQFADVCDFFAQLKVRRWLDLAEGVQLDRIGDIVCLTRGEAGYLACIDQSVEVLPDDEYRKYLIFKIWKNTNNCTYYDVLKAFRMFWPRPLYYHEDPERPATMLFETEILKPGEMDVQQLFKAPIIRAAGVGIWITAITQADEQTSQLYTYSHLGRGLSITPIPEVFPEWPSDISLWLSGMMPRWYKTIIERDETRTGLVVHPVPETWTLEIWEYLEILGNHKLRSRADEENLTVVIENAGLAVDEHNPTKSLIITGG
jgi:hypothetical protein